jgi:hypothetical protein
MAGRAAGGHYKPQRRNQALGPREEEGAMASSPCSEATADERDGEEEAVAEIGGNGGLGWCSSRQGQELHQATTSKTWCKGAQ